MEIVNTPTNSGEFVNSSGRSSPDNNISKEVISLCPFCDESPIPSLPSHLLSNHPDQLKSDQKLLLEDANLLLTVGVGNGNSSRPVTPRANDSSSSGDPFPVNLSLRSSDDECKGGGNNNSAAANRKRRKQTQVPEVNKDERYWARRLKNNEAAKRSRDMRIMRERVIFEENARLERLASDLRGELERASMDNKELTLKMGLILEENSRLKALLSLLQTKAAAANNNNHLLECNELCDRMTTTNKNNNNMKSRLES